MRPIRWVLPFLVAMLVHPAAQAQNRGGTLRVAMSADIQGTNPGLDRDSNTDNVLQHIVEGLVAYRANGTPAPMLAESVEERMGGRQYVFRLRDGLRFHNGAPVTAREVKWSWDRYLDPATRWRCLAQFDGSEGIKVTAVRMLDERTVAFELDAANALFLSQMASFQCGGGAILHPDSVGPDGQWRGPVATGPYTLCEWRRGQFLELCRFDGYAARQDPTDGYAGRRRPLLDRIRWIIMPEPAVVRAALLAGDVDIWTDVAEADRRDLMAQPDLHVTASPTFYFNLLLIQSNDPLFRDARIRRAIATAIDIQEVANVVTGGTGSANGSPIPTTSGFHSPAVARRHAFDRDHARSELRAAGYRGQRITLLTNRRVPRFYDIAVVVQSMLQAAGMNVQIEVLDWATQLRRYSTGQYQMQVFAFSPRLDPTLSFEALTGDRSRDPRKVWGSPEAIEMIEASVRTSDREARQAIFDRLQARFLEDVPAVGLFNAAEIVAARRNVRGYESWPAQKARYWNVWLE